MREWRCVDVSLIARRRQFLHARERQEPIDRQSVGGPRGRPEICILCRHSDGSDILARDRWRSPCFWIRRERARYLRLDNTITYVSPVLTSRPANSAVSREPRRQTAARRCAVAVPRQRGGIAAPRSRSARDLHRYLPSYPS